MRVHQSPRGLMTDGRTPTTGLLQRGLTICLSNKFQVRLLLVWGPRTENPHASPLTPMLWDRCYGSAG